MRKLLALALCLVSCHHVNEARMPASYTLHKGIRRPPEQQTPVFDFSKVLKTLTQSPRMAYVGHDPKYKIAILDTGVSEEYMLAPIKLCANGHYDFKTNAAVIASSHSHGSYVASIIGASLKDVDYCLIIYQMANDTGVSLDNMIAAFKRLRTEKVTAVNISLAGGQFSYGEFFALQHLTKRGVKVFVASGNDNKNLSDTCTTFPACYQLENLVSVAALSSDLTQKAKYSNYGRGVIAWYPGDLIVDDVAEYGTSFATPRALADYVSALAQDQ